jgi:methylmalonyl-CoA/ethylmalonyl-CoA epimerase
VSAFLKKGGGLHHLCYELNDLESHLQEMRARKAIVLRPPKPAVAFEGRRMAWVLTAEKLLLLIPGKSQSSKPLIQVR